MTSASNFTVFMHRDLVDALDEQLSPFDGLQAIDEIFIELPLKHRPHRMIRLSRRRPKSLQLYHGRFGWVDIGFSYVQIGSRFHVVQLWEDQNWAKADRRETGCVIGKRTA
jgi:hypothetical protein